VYSALFGAKKFGLFEIYGGSALTEEEGKLRQCGYFANKMGGEVNFCDFVWTSFMGF